MSALDHAYANIIVLARHWPEAVRFDPTLKALKTLPVRITENDKGRISKIGDADRFCLAGDPVWFEAQGIYRLMDFTGSFTMLEIQKFKDIRNEQTAYKLGFRAVEDGQWYSKDYDDLARAVGAAVIHIRKRSKPIVRAQEIQARRARFDVIAYHTS